MDVILKRVGRRVMRDARTALVALVLSVPMVGCDGLQYVAHVTEGQFAVQGDLESIDAVLASERLSEDESNKLQVAVAARNFAADVMGLRVGDSYTRFYDAGADPLAFNLTAVRQDALTPQTWEFPILGEVPYLSFFDEGYLREVQAELDADGFDTFTYELDAYSTLGVFEDPIRSPMLRRGVISLSDTIIHELLHNTVWRSNATTFNESLATFVGRQGAIEFLAAYYGEDSGWPETAVAYFADLDTAAQFLADFADELAEYYASDLSSAAKIAGREALWEAARERFVNEVQPTLNYPDIFTYGTMQTNNAWLLGSVRYNSDRQVFADVYDATGRDWRATIEVFTAAAQADDEPVAYLDAWLAKQRAVAGE